MIHAKLIADYLAGPQMLHAAVAGMTAEQFDARPVPGKWSTRGVVCHLADCEVVYSDRMKRAIAEDEPTIFSLNPDGFASRLAYEARAIEEEVRLVEAVRAQMARILRTLQPADFQRCVIHSEDGPLTLETLLQRISNHIPHHVQFIEEKRATMK